MTKCPVNPRSEFHNRLSLGVSVLRKADDGLVVDTSRRFHAASPAFHTPGLRFTRGSGLGADTDMSGVGATLPVTPTVEVDVAHAPRAITPIASDRDGMSDSRFTRDSGSEIRREG